MWVHIPLQIRDPRMSFKHFRSGSKRAPFAGMKCAGCNGTIPWTTCVYIYVCRRASNSLIMRLWEYRHHGSLDPAATLEFCAYFESSSPMMRLTSMRVVPWLLLSEQGLKGREVVAFNRLEVVILVTTSNWYIFTHGVRLAERVKWEYEVYLSIVFPYERQMTQTFQLTAKNNRKLLDVLAQRITRSEALGTGNPWNRNHYNQIYLSSTTFRHTVPKAENFKQADVITNPESPYPCEHLVWPRQLSYPPSRAHDMMEDMVKVARKVPGLRNVDPSSYLKRDRTEEDSGGTMVFL